MFVIVKLKLMMMLYKVYSN